MNNLGAYVTSFTMYKFIKDVTTPFTQLPAYRLGIIDARGNKKKEPTTPQEKEAYSPYYQMIINVKKVFEKVPDPKTRAQLQSVVAAIKLFGEDVEKVGGDSLTLFEGIDNFFRENGVDLKEEKMDLMFEDAPVNSMGAGAFGNTSVGGDPVSRSPAIAGFDVPLLLKMMRRKKKKNARKSTDN